MKRLLSILLFLSATFAYAAAKPADNPGYGPVKLNANIRKLPKTSDGFYDTIQPLPTTESPEYTFKYNGHRVAVAMVDNGKIYSVRIASPSFSTKSGLGLHSTAEDIFKAGGKAYCDNSGYVGLVCDGVLFKGMKLTAAGDKKAEDAYLYGTEQNFTVADYVKGSCPVEIILADVFASSDIQSPKAQKKKDREPLSVPGWIYWVFMAVVLVLSGLTIVALSKDDSSDSWVWKFPLTFVYLSVIAFFFLVAKGAMGADTALDDSAWKGFFKFGGFCALVAACLYLVIEARVAVKAPPFADWLESICMLACTVVFWGLLCNAAGVFDFTTRAYEWGMQVFGKKITIWATLLTAILIPAILEGIFLFVIFPLSAAGGRLYLVVAQMVLMLPIFIGSFDALGDFSKDAKFLASAAVYLVHVCAYLSILVRSYNYLITHKCPYCHSMAHSSTVSVEEGAPVVTHSSGSNTEKEVNERPNEVEEVTTTTHYDKTKVWENQIHSMHCSKCGYDWEEKIFTKDHTTVTPTSREIETKTIRW